MKPACRIASSWLLFTSLLPAGVVTGTVLEHSTGYPLARARVRLERIDTTGRVESASVLAGRTGAFTFAGVAEGLYVLSATRSGYASSFHGQRRPEGSAPPFAVNKDSNLFVELRLRKLAAISGRVLDENRVGIAGVGVSAYPLGSPFRVATSAVSDDGGVYRLHGLMPGRYRVRTAPYRHDDGLTLLPTFGPEALAAKDSAVAEARLDQETLHVDVTPVPGSLISIGGPVTCAANVPAGPVTVTISHETIRRTIVTACQTAYRADNLQPGSYEIFAVDSTGRLAAFIEQSIHQNTLNATVELRELPGTRIRLLDADGRTPIAGSGKLTLSRVDLYGIAETREAEVTGSTRPEPLILPPGYWEVAGTLASPLYLSAVHPLFRISQPRPTAHPDRFEILHDSRWPDIVLRARSGVSSLSGRVVDSGVPAAGIPVFLWPADADTRRLARGTRTTTANSRGEFRWEGLPPGQYRLGASFDLASDQAESVDGSTLLTLRDGGGTSNHELAPIPVP